MDTAKRIELAATLNGAASQLGRRAHSIGWATRDGIPTDDDRRKMALDLLAAKELIETLDEALRGLVTPPEDRWAERQSAYTVAQIQAAREWMKDCEWRDLDADEIDDLDADEVIAGVDRHYVGGWSGFVAEMEATDATPAEIAAMMERVQVTT